MSEERKQYAIDALLAEIFARSEDRGFLAELRRGLNPSTEEQSWPHIAKYASLVFDDESRRRVCAVVGALAATLVPDGLCTDGYASIGVVMRKIKEGEPSLGESGIKSYETKFRRLLNSPTTLDLCDLVSEVGRNAARKRVVVNCRSLFWDLWKWDDAEAREKIRVRWARDFYGVFERSGNQVSKDASEEVADA